MEHAMGDTIRQVLTHFPDIKLAFVFGSAARDRLTAASDVDIAVAADARLDLETRLQLAMQLSQALHREVDLIDLHEVSGTILQQSLCEGTPLLLHDTVLYAELIKRMWFDQADMMPYTRRILAERRRRFLHG